MKYLIIPFLFVFVSCQSIDDKMSAYIGKHKSVVLQDWGAPSQITEDGKGGQILNYQQQSSWNINVIISRAFYANKEGIIYYYRWQGH